ncbi:hypothetical protein ACUR5C_00830 [Aliikangiella sp. IMCC44653]
MSGFLVAWYYLLLKDFMPQYNLFEAIQNLVASNKVMILFLGAGLLVARECFIGWRNVYQGEVFEFNRHKNKALRNGKQYFRISDVNFIQLRRIYDSDGADIFRVSVILNNGDKKMIESSTSQTKVTSIVANLADVLDVSIVRK